MTALFGLNVGSARAAGVARPLPDVATAQGIVWLHLDRAEPVHVTADARLLPFRNSMFDIVHCSHLVEHVPIDDVVPMLREMRRVVKCEGYGYFAAPDVDRARTAGSRMWTEYGIHGGVFYNGWQHYWTCTATMLRNLLKQGGWGPRWCLGLPANHPPNLHSWPVDFEARYLAKRDDSIWPNSFPADAYSKAQIQ